MIKRSQIDAFCCALSPSACCLCGQFLTHFVQVNESFCISDNPSCGTPFAVNYINAHIQVADQLNKPFVVRSWNNISPIRLFQHLLVSA